MAGQRENAPSEGFEKPPNVLDRYFGHFVAALGILGSLLTFALAILIVYDVLSREIANHAVAGIAEIVGMAVASIVFLQIGQAVRSERLTRNHSLINNILKTRPTLGHVFEALFYFFGALVFAMIFATTVPYFLHAFASSQYVGGVMGVFVPVWPIKAITLIGSVTTAIQFALHMWRHMRLAAKRGH